VDSPFSVCVRFRSDQVVDFWKPAASVASWGGKGGRGFKRQCLTRPLGVGRGVLLQVDFFIERKCAGKKGSGWRASGEVDVGAVLVRIHQTAIGVTPISINFRRICCNFEFSRGTQPGSFHYPLLLQRILCFCPFLGKTENPLLSLTEAGSKMETWITRIPQTNGHTLRSFPAVCWDDPKLSTPR
jgi:hypothetical protein